VLFSGPFRTDGWTHDPQYKELSALSTTVRASIYPVDTRGLQVGPLGGPLALRRLANETGGRMTADTNELGMAYAKARRDSGCTYTLGFYDRRARLDDERRITIRLNEKEGRRIVYPEYYVLRSPEEKRKSLFRTAAMAPQVFESSELNTDLFVLAPHSAERWSGVLAVEVRLGPDTFIFEDEEWELRLLVRRPNGTILRSFTRKIPMPASDPAGGPKPVVTLFEELRVRPGEYLVTAVLSDPDGDRPLATTRPAIVSKIPRGKPFMIGPILGNRSETADETGARGARRGRPGFAPLLVQETEKGDPLESLTVVCIVESELPVELSALAREVTAWDGGDSLRFDPVSARFAGQGTLECHHQYDRVATDGLEPGRYELNATAETSEFIAGSGSVEFTVLESAPK